MLPQHVVRTSAVSAVVFLLLLLVAGAHADSGTGSLSITSVPSGASVYLDGTLVGTTPFSSDAIPAGDHSILLTLAGYEDCRAATTVPAGGSVEGTYTLVPAATAAATTTPAPSAGELYVASDPPGATVAIDGTVRGTTPLTLSSVSAGEHTVLLTLAGYADFSSTVTVLPGGSVRDTYTLSCNVLSVSSSPSGAAVSLDGTVRGTTPVSLRAVTAGDHALVLTLDGYDTLKETVTVRPGSELVTSYTLTEAGSPTTAATTAAETTAAATTLSTTATTAPVTTAPATTVQTVTPTPTPTPPEACTLYYTGTAEPGVSFDGTLNCTAVIAATDGIVTLTIPAGTRITLPAGLNGTPISIVPLAPAAVPAAPGGLVSTGYASQFQPDGTTFDRPAAIVFRLDKDSWDRYSAHNLTIAATSGTVWEMLPTTLDPATFSVSAPVQHFSTIGLFIRAPAAVPAAEPAEGSVRDTIRSVVAPANATHPLSPYLPGASAPVGAVATGVALTVAGGLAAGSSLVGRSWEQLLAMLKKFLGMEAVGLMSTHEVKKRHIAPAKNLTEVFFCLSAREMLVIAASILGFTVAFLLQARLSLVVSTFIIFICAGGLATILHELAHKIVAYRVGCQTEYQFWTLGTITMFFTAGLFGTSFGKPSRTLITSSEKTPSPKENAAIKLAGPLANLGVAIVSLALLPLGGLFTVLGAAGFAMNLLNFVFSLIPLKPNDGMEVYRWNKAVWALLFFPLLVVYLWLYL